MFKKFIIGLFLFIYISCASSNCEPKTIIKEQPTTFPALVEKEINNFVQIELPFTSARCNGIRVSNYVLTAAHCVYDLQNVAVYSFLFNGNEVQEKRDSDYYEVYLVHWNNDLAILVEHGEKPDITNRNISIIDPFIADRVYFIDKHLTKKVAYITKTHTPISLLETGQEIDDAYEMLAKPEKGNSGSPIWNEQGELLGTISGGINDRTYFVRISP